MLIGRFDGQFSEGSRVHIIYISLEAYFKIYTYFYIFFKVIFFLDTSTWGRARAKPKPKPKPNRVPFDKRGLLRSAKLCQMCPSCTCCYLIDSPPDTLSPHPPRYYLSPLLASLPPAPLRHCLLGDIFQPLDTDRVLCVSDFS